MENSKLMTWYNNQLEKDKFELEFGKQKIVQQIKSFKKDDLIHIQKPISLWKRIAKVLGF
jgi:hypothetical protein